jgi:DNA-binding MarR family transcriptional regulator
VVNDLAERLRPVLLKLNRELRRELAGLGVTGGQVALLFAIRRSPGIGVRELAAQERMSAAAMSGYVARLERAGLLERIPDPHDRRRHGLAVTGKGERLLRTARSRRTAWLADGLRRLSPDELAAVEAAVAPLGRLLEERP